MSAGQSGFLPWIGKRLPAGLVLLLCFASHSVQAAGDICFTCQKEIRFTVYTWTDKVTRTKVMLCGDCTELPDNCYLCSMPLLKGATTLPDGRAICKRDLRSVVLDEQQALQICEQVKQDLDRLLIRFLTIPETNVTIQLMDRVRLQELFKVIGNDYTCPNALGCTEAKTNDGHRTFEISLLSGLPKEDLMTTCVHEYAHTWIIENVPARRQKTIGKDAVEGFCELLSYLFAEQQGLHLGKSNILANHYTRGQIHLFIAAHQQYGLQDIVDWMKAGDDRLLLRSDLSRVRRLADRPALAPVPKVAPTVTTNPPVAVVPPKLPEKLVLQGIVWSKTQPMATISGRNFDVNQELVLQLRDGPITVRCLEICPTAVVLQTNQAPDHLVLELK
jgi:hypothetical protein